MPGIYVTNSPVYASPINKDGVSGYQVEHAFNESFWMEKSRFESKFLPVSLPTGDVPEFQQRIYAERAQLADRISKLAAFTGTDKFLDLESSAQTDLNIQLDCMLSYRRVLDERLVALKAKEVPAL